jgi:asparagine synthase (glutamine-hydrolysing)
MYFSIELRGPYLNYRIVEKKLATPEERIIHKGYTKWILREAMAGRVPEAIRLRRDKIGFENPSSEWFKTPQMRDLIQSALCSQKIRESGFFNLVRLEREYRLHLEGKINIATEIWKLINMDYFLHRISAPS